MKAILKESLISGLVAATVCLSFVLALQLTNLPVSLRMGISWFAFMIVSPLMHDRLSKDRRTRGQWIATVLFAVVASGMMGWVATLN